MNISDKIEEMYFPNRKAEIEARKNKKFNEDLARKEYQKEKVELKKLHIDQRSKVPFATEKTLRNTIEH